MTSGFISWGTVVAVLAIAFTLGFAPVVVIRCISRIYPKGHPRRYELVAELCHVKGLARTLEQWRWLGEMLATAVCEGIPLRAKSIRKRRKPRHPAVREVYYFLDENQNLTLVDPKGEAKDIYFSIPASLKDVHITPPKGYTIVAEDLRDRRATPIMKPPWYRRILRRRRRQGHSARRVSG